MIETYSQRSLNAIGSKQLCIYAYKFHYYNVKLKDISLNMKFSRAYFYFLYRK